MIDLQNVFYGNYEAEEKSVIKRIEMTPEQINSHKWGIYNVMSELCNRELDFNESHKKRMGLLFDYFTGVENKSYDLNKGLYIVGDTGVGKSLIFDVFKFFTSEILQKNSFKVFQFKQIVSDYKKTGAQSLDKLFGKDGYTTPTIYIDDFLSTNSDVNHFQNYENVAESIIMEREIIYTRKNKLTHFSSNIHPSESGLDARSVGRISQMCNIIEFAGKNYRIK